MPISGINPDGSVKIYNKNTGQVLDVKPEELPKYNGSLVGEYQKLKTQHDAVNNAVKAAQGGNSKAFDSLPADLKTQAIASGAQIAAPKSAQEIKKEQAGNKVASLIKTLETRYQKAGGGEVNVPALNRLVGLQKDIAGAIGADDETNTFNREREGFIATLKGLTGDTGVMTEQDAQRLINLIPGMGASPGEAKNLFNDLRTQSASELGGNGGKTTINPKTKGIIDVVAPNAKALVQDSYKTATTGTPEEKLKKLQQQQQDFSNPILMAANALSGNKQSQQDAGATSDLMNIATGPENIMTAIKAPAAIAGKIFPGSAAKTARESIVDAAETAGKTIDGEKIAQKFVDWSDHAYRANSGKEKQVDNVINSVINQYSGKKLSPKDAMKIWLESKDGYKADGTTKTALEGKVDIKMREILRPYLEEVAPGFDELTKKMAKDIGNKKAAKWAAGIIGSTLLGGATIYGANKLAGGGR